MTNKNYVMFNNSLIDFLDDIRDVLSDLKEYDIIYTSAKFLSKVDPQKNQRMFEKFIGAPYRDEIMSKNESFFLSSDRDFNNSDTQLVNMLKSMWGTMGDANRETVWKHMQVLAILSTRCSQ
jgi:hypothetical protein